MSAFAYLQQAAELLGRVELIAVLHLHCLRLELVVRVRQLLVVDRLDRVLEGELHILGRTIEQSTCARVVFFFFTIIPLE